MCATVRQLTHLVVLGIHVAKYVFLAKNSPNFTPSVRCSNKIIVKKTR